MSFKSKDRCSKFKLVQEIDCNGDCISDWCAPSQKPEDGLCLICNTIINCRHHGVSAIKRHASSKKHIDLCMKKRNEKGEFKNLNSQKRLDFDMQQKIKIVNTHSDNVTTAETIFAFSVANCNIPYSFGDTSSKLFSTMFNDSKIAKDFSCGRQKLSYVISDGIGPFLKEKMISEIIKSNAFYSIQIDETPIAEKRRQQVDVLIRFYSETFNKITVEYLESFHIGHGTAHNLHSCVMASLSELPQSKLLSFHSDGPNVMKSLTTKLKESHPNLIDIGFCSLHKVHNAFSSALNAFGGDIESLMIDIFYFFKRSAAMSEDFRNLQCEMEIKEHVFLRHVSSRWLTLLDSVIRFIEQYHALKKFFGSSVCKSKDTARLVKIKMAFSDPQLLAKALFLKNASKLFTGFLLLFQRDEPLVHILYDELVNLVKKILGRFMVTKSFLEKSGRELEFIDLHSSENWRQQIEIGLDTKQELENVSVSDKKKFHVCARSFYIAASDYLIKVLPLSNKNLERMKCLHPLFRTKVSSLTCIRQLAAALPNVIAASDVALLADEWIRLQSENIDEELYLEEKISDSLEDDDESQTDDECDKRVYKRIDSYWSHIFCLKDTIGNLKYQYISILVKALLSLAHGNADCERGFSINKNILDSRSNLNIDSLNGIRRIKSYVSKCGGIHQLNIGPDLLCAVKGSWRRYQNRLQKESNSEEIRKKENEMPSKKRKLDDEAVVLRNQLAASQSMLNLAEKMISEGLKKKSFFDIESGQVLLKESKEKISATLTCIDDNKSKLEKWKVEVHQHLKKTKFQNKCIYCGKCEILKKYIVQF